MSDPGADFEIQVGESVYDVVPNQAFSIVTPGGERVEMVLRPKEVIRFAGHGVSFQRPRSMRVSSEEESGVVTITAESAESPLVMMIQLYPAPARAEDVRESLVENFQEEFRSRNAELPAGGPKAASRTVGGVRWEGRALEFALGKQRLKAEIYTFSKGGGVLAVILQHDLSDAGQAEKCFSVITDSLE